MTEHDSEIVPIRDKRQRVDLLARKHKTARFCTCQSGSAFRVTHPMPFPFRHYLGSTMQALFSLDHLAWNGELDLAG